MVERIYEETEGLDPLAKMSDVDIQIWLEGDIYLNVDKMSTAAGLEIRMPLTDRRIFDIASRMPSRFKVNDEQNKGGFPYGGSQGFAGRNRLPEKLGFIVPIRIWMADERYNQVYRQNSTARWRSVFDLMRSMPSLTIMSAEIRITGGRFGLSILSLCGMKSIS